MNNYIVGIDLGSSKICAAAGKPDRYGKLQITAITSVECNGINKGIVVDIDNTSESIEKCIEQLERMVDISIKDIYLSIPGAICEIVYNKGVIAISSDDGEIKQNDVDRVLKASKIITIPSDKEIVGVVPQQYIVDGHSNVKDPVGMSGLKLEVDAQIILSQTTVINNIFKSINRIGVKIKGIVFHPLAISDVILKKDEMEMGTALIDIGSDTANISIYKNGNLCYFDMIPLGGNTITNDISLCLKIPYSEAEKIKIKYGKLDKSVVSTSEKIKLDSNYDSVIQIEYKTLIEIIEARVEEILYLINKRLNLSGYSEEISGIVLTGGGIALIEGISYLSKNILRKPVRIGVPEYIGAENPAYSGAVGVVHDVLSSMKDNDIQDNHESDKFDDLHLSKKKSNDSGIVSKIKDFFTDFF